MKQQVIKRYPNEVIEYGFNANKVYAFKSRVTGRWVAIVSDMNGKAIGMYEDDMSCGTRYHPVHEGHARKVRKQFEAYEQSLPDAPPPQKGGASIEDTYNPDDIVGDEAYKQSIPEPWDDPNFEGYIDHMLTVNELIEAEARKIEDWENTIANENSETVQHVLQLQNTEEQAAQALPISQTEEQQVEEYRESLIKLLPAVSDLDETFILALKLANALPEYSAFTQPLVEAAERIIDGNIQTQLALTVHTSGEVLEQHHDKDSIIRKYKYAVRIQESQEYADSLNRSPELKAKLDLPLIGVFEQSKIYDASIAFAVIRIIPRRDYMIKTPEGERIITDTPIGRIAVPVAVFQNLHPEVDLDKPIHEGKVLSVKTFDDLEAAVNFLLSIIITPENNRRAEVLEDISTLIIDVENLRGVTRDEVMECCPFAFMEVPEYKV